MLPEPPPERTHHDSNPRHRPPTRSHPLRPFGQRQPRRFVCRLGRSRPCKSPGVPWTPEKKERIQWVYTVDVTVSGREDRAIRQGGAKAGPAPIFRYEIPHPSMPPGAARCGRLWSGRHVCRPGFGGGRPSAFGPGTGPGRRLPPPAGGGILADRPSGPRCNVQFGEGGAGTFSDGKLNTGTPTPGITGSWSSWSSAAPRSKSSMTPSPIWGPTCSLTVVQNLRRRVEKLGGEVRFQTQLTGLEHRDGSLAGALSGGTRRTGALPCRQLILAIGHSARDTFSMLASQNIAMEPKPFAMGVRIEHLQHQIDLAQYGGKPLRAAPGGLQAVLPPAGPDGIHLLHIAPAAMWWLQPLRKVELSPTA